MLAGISNSQLQNTTHSQKKGRTDYSTRSDKTAMVRDSVLQGKKGNEPGFATITHKNR
jgi:hypothetical protein